MDRRKYKNIFLTFCVILIGSLIFTGIKASAANKYYTLKELGITDYSRCAIKSLKGNKVTYYRTKWADIYHDGMLDIVRAGAYKTAKITPKTKYYAEDIRKFNYSGGNMFEQRYIRRITKKQFFNKRDTMGKNLIIIKQRYTCAGCCMKLTIKKGKTIENRAIRACGRVKILKE